MDFEALLIRCSTGVVGIRLPVDNLLHWHVQWLVIAQEGMRGVQGEAVINEEDILRKIRKKRTYGKPGSFFIIGKGCG